MKWMRWAPAALLGFGCFLSLGTRAQLEMPLRLSLAEAIPIDMAGYHGTDHELSRAERDVAGVTTYSLRSYHPAGVTVSELAAFSVYVGYYDRQTRGRTIHSPRNCLPGGGWEALASSTANVNTSLGPVTVNRYLLQRDGERALVLYWYQGRGRVEASEYQVKIDLLRDAALERRSEEALARIVVPVQTTEDDALLLASKVAAALVPALQRALPD